MVEVVREHYFDLPISDQTELLRSLATVMGRRAEILEKDIWLCTVLDTLFNLPCRKPMAFKGGTSLSKVYQAIDRFSEDIDVTVDYRSLVADAPDLESLNSNSQRSKLSNELKAGLITHVVEELIPALHLAIKDKVPNQKISIESSDDAEKLWLFYPSAVENTDTYLRPSILIEFGGRNSTLPHNLLSITPDIAAHVPELAFPIAEVSVLSAARTFWEKVTLIHVDCHRTNLRPGAERLSRHWYDLARLADQNIGKQAVEDKDLLSDVLLIKETFYRSRYSHYDRCISGELRLIPEPPLLEALHEDYEAMHSAQMFYGELLSFEEILVRLKELEREINSSECV
jgi:hypothetical protein